MNGMSLWGNWSKDAGSSQLHRKALEREASLLSEHGVACPVPAQFVVISAPGQLSPSLPLSSLRSFLCVADRSQSRRPRPDPGPCISPTHTFVGPLKDAGGLHEPETFVASVSLYILPLSHGATRSC